MNMSSPRRLVWTARILGVLFAAFTSVFAADVFSERMPVWLTMIALAMHLIPTAIVVLLLAIAWRAEAIGGLLFVLAGIGYLAFVVAGNHPLSWIVPISGPLVLVGALFLVSWMRAERKAMS